MLLRSSPYNIIGKRLTLLSLSLLVYSNSVSIPPYLGPTLGDNQVEFRYKSVSEGIKSI